ncbi:hypothetical protein CIG75_17555 [Tumebacillus algifaecis]|uniref:Peptidase S9 prolyl oligopeptidase catalytic domain-containing protein n=1 Tax=Tumebacillus algifaecis TaxID=1214604 RepID=A0A223D4U0_9BACL|nr:alpha/beta fold hydrolase [Tumebacillus algifaecis]ASS76591.1 hypothetical protein CIG75_17555 [Tumebacillus algifaecis]
MIPNYLEKLEKAVWLQHFSFTTDGTLLLGCNTQHGSRVYIHATDTPMVERSTHQMYPFGTSQFVGFLEHTENGYQVVCHDLNTQTEHLPALAPLTYPIQPSVYGEEHIVGLRVNADGQQKLVLVHHRNDEEPIELLDLPNEQKADQLYVAVAPRRRAIIVTRKTTGPYTELVLCDPETKSSRVLLSGEGNMTPVSAQWNLEESALICLVRVGRRLDAVQIEVESGEHVRLNLPLLAEAPIWNPDGRSLLLTLDEWPGTRFATYHLESKEVVPFDLLPGVAHSIPRWREGALYFKVASSQQPPALYRWQPEQNELQCLTRQQDFSQTAPPEVIGIETERGYAVPCLVYPPAKEQKRAVFLLHGGPSGAWDISWSPWIQLLQSLGMRVILVNPRGSTVRNWPLPPLKPGEFGKLDVLDVIDCIREAINRSWASPVQIGLYGESYGGYLATRTAQALGDEVGALLIMSSYLNVTVLKNSRDPVVRRFAEYAFTSEELEPSVEGELWTPDFPILQVHGEHDLQLPLADVNVQFEKLGGHGHELYVLAGEGHTIRNRSNICAWIGKGAQFFDDALRSVQEE